MLVSGYFIADLRGSIGASCRSLRCVDKVSFSRQIPQCCADESRVFRDVTVLCWCWEFVKLKRVFAL